MPLLRVSKLTGLNFKKDAFELHQEIQKIKLVNRGKTQIGSLKGFLQSQCNDKYLCIKIYKEYTRNGNFFNGDADNLDSISISEGESKSLLIDARGYMLYEVSRFFHMEEIKELLNTLFEKQGLKIHFHDVENFDLKTMRTFFKTAKEVKHLKIKKVGEVAPNPTMPPEDIEKALQDMGENVSSINMDAGRNKSLKNSKLINDGLARRSEILEVRGVDNDRASFTVSKNGRINTTVPKEINNAGDKLYKIIEKIFGILQ